MAVTADSDRSRELAPVPCAARSCILRERLAVVHISLLRDFPDWITSVHRGPVTRCRHVEPLRFATRLHAFLAKWYAAVTTAANRTTAAIQIQNTGVELSIVNSPK
jgi:hypothetical protein